MRHYFNFKMLNGKLEAYLALVEITRRLKSAEISGEYVDTESTEPHIRRSSDYRTSFDDRLHNSCP